MAGRKQTQRRHQAPSCDLGELDENIRSRLYYFVNPSQPCSVKQSTVPVFSQQRALRYTITRYATRSLDPCIGDLVPTRTWAITTY